MIVNDKLIGIEDLQNLRIYNIGICYYSVRPDYNYPLYPLHFHRYNPSVRCNLQISQHCAFSPGKKV